MSKESDSCLNKPKNHEKKRKKVKVTKMKETVISEEFFNFGNYAVIYTCR